LPLKGTLTRYLTAVPVALSVLAKPLPVNPPLLLSTVPSTPQKPVVFSWMMISVPPELEDELELDDELELLLELDELLELLFDEEDELEDELLLVDDDELDELLELLVLDVLEPPSPVQLGNTKLPLCVPWKPKLVLCPADNKPFHETFVAVTELPDVDTLAFHEPVMPGL
jgi:hypothetical protein